MPGVRNIRNIVLAGCSLFLLCQCATQDDLRKLNYQLRAVNQKVEEVKNSTVENLQKRQASSVNKIDRVDEEITRLQARMEENDHRQAQNHQQITQALSDMQAALEERLAADEQKISELQQQVEQLANGIDSMQRARIREAEKRAREAAKKAELARQRTIMAATAGTSFVKVVPAKRKIRIGEGGLVESNRTTAGAPQSKPKAKAPETETKVTKKSSVETVKSPDKVSGPFARAMAEFKAGKYKKAYGDFEKVLSRNPRGEQAAKTLFYMGESLYRQGEYDLAILDYQKVISNHAKDPHAPAALLKQGMSFEKLTDNETAKIIYKKLINEYAGTPEAIKAGKRLQNL